MGHFTKRPEKCIMTLFPCWTKNKKEPEALCLRPMQHQSKQKELLETGHWNDGAVIWEKRKV